MNKAPNLESYVLRPFQAGDELPINAEFNRIFGKQRSLVEWNWKYGKNADHSLIYVVSDANDNILAHYGGRKMRIWLNQQEIEGGHITDSFATRIAPIVRGQWFNKLRSAFFDKYGGDQIWPVMYGFPGERAKRQALHSQSHKEHFPVTRWHSNSDHLYQQDKKGRKTGRGYLTSPQADQLWIRSQSRYEFCVVRDSHWLDWRFRQHPHSEKYHPFWVGKSNIWKSLPEAWAVFCENESEWLCVDLLWDGQDENALDALFAVAAGNPFGRSLQLWLDADTKLAGYLASRNWDKQIWHDGPQYSCRCFSGCLQDVIRPAAFYRTAADLDIL